MQTAKEKTEEMQLQLAQFLNHRTTHHTWDKLQEVIQQAYLDEAKDILRFLKGKVKLIDCDVSLSKALNYHTVEDLKVD